METPKIISFQKSINHDSSYLYNNLFNLNGKHFSCLFNSTNNNIFFVPNTEEISLQALKQQEIEKKTWTNRFK